MTDSLTGSPTWIQEMLAHLKTVKDAIHDEVKLINLKESPPANAHIFVECLRQAFARSANSVEISISKLLLGEGPNNQNGNSRCIFP